MHMLQAEILLTGRVWHLSDTLHLIWIRFEAVLENHVSHKFHFCAPELDLFLVQLDALFAATFK